MRLIINPNKMKNLILIISFLFATFLSSCEKEITGCTNSSAINYNPNADVDNYSCQYQGSIVFWYNQTTAQIFNSNNINSLIYYVDNQIIGSSSTSVYFTAIPDCGYSGAITYTSNMGSNMSESILVKVKDETGFILYEFAVMLQADVCLQQELS